VHSQFQQQWALPVNPMPIVIIGTGDIVNDAHMPAYRKSGFDVVGMYDIDSGRAHAAAAKWNVGRVYKSLAEATRNGSDCVYDLATPPSAIIDILPHLPDGAAVLIQKPMGENLGQAETIQSICRAKGFSAAVNFQLRFSPMMLAVRDAIRSGAIGDVLDIEVHINILTPWEIFPFLRSMERVEIAVHSIHYLDLIRSVVGEPERAFVRSLGDPRVPELAQTRTSIILDYGRWLRVLLSINHNHSFGRNFQDATFRFEGTDGCAVVKLGLLLDYPHGEPDELWFCKAGGEWQNIALSGCWFPDAFANIMSNVQRYYRGEDPELLTSVDDALHTMQLVESCFAQIGA
jgi:predicted dehydrogenase